jgi:hypothetical protein
LRHSESIGRSDRPRNPALYPRALDGGNAPTFALRKRIGEECPHSRKFASRRSIAQAAFATFREIGAKFDSSDGTQLVPAYERSAVVAQKADKTMRGSDIGADGMLGSAPITSKMLRPFSRNTACRVLWKVRRRI